MRHFLKPGPVTTLTLGVGKATPATVLIARRGGTPGRPPCRRRTALVAVAVAPVAVATDRHLTATTGAVEQAGSIGHRQFLPMSPGQPPTSGRYSPTARAMHAPGCGTGYDCGGRYQCRTCLNGTVPLEHRAALVTPLPGQRAHAPSPARSQPSLTTTNKRVFTALNGVCPHYPPNTRGFSPPSTRPICGKAVRGPHRGRASGR